MKKQQMKLLIWAVALLTFSACNSKTEDTAMAEQASEEAATASETKFGVEVSPDEAVTLASLEQEIGDQEQLEGVTVAAKVTEVCQAKGCWMKLEKEDGEAIRVTFKDYALFMPKDIVGKEVVIHGKAMNQTVSVDDLRHYAEDAGKSEEEIAAIIEPEYALAFEADGVSIQ